MAELADALDLGSSAQKACRFKSCSRHQVSLIPKPVVLLELRWSTHGVISKTTP